MDGEGIELGERSRVDQQLDPLAGRQLPFRVLLLIGSPPRCIASYFRCAGC